MLRRGGGGGSPNRDGLPSTISGALLFLFLLLFLSFFLFVFFFSSFQIFIFFLFFSSFFFLDIVSFLEKKKITFEDFA